MAGGKILIVEDEVIVARDIQNVLKSQGYEVPVICETGEEAIQRADEIKPDLVLMDIILKGQIDGIEAAEHIHNSLNIPIIYLTACKDEKTLDRARQAEPYGYLLKPFAERELYTTIEMAMFKHKREEEVLKIQKLESLGILAGGIAHDFNNILTAILGNISLTRFKVKNDDELKLLLDEAEKACWRARELTEQLLTFAKGGVPVKRVQDVKEIIKSTAKFSLRGSNVTARFHFLETPIFVNMDAGQINQVIQNLVINAREAMPNGGVIDIFSDIIEIDKDNSNLFLMDGLELKQGKYIKISIKDEGTGIDPKILYKIFDPYFSTKQNGNGLGLAIAYSIIKRHGGYIGIDSKSVKGSCFFILLPESEPALIP